MKTCGRTSRCSSANGPRPFSVAAYQKPRTSFLLECGCCRELNGLSLYSYRQQTHKDSVESFASEWLEIGRTLARNTSLVNEMSLDLKVKKSILEKCTKHLFMLQTHASNAGASDDARHSSQSTDCNIHCLQTAGYRVTNSAHYSPLSHSSSLATNNRADGDDEIRGRISTSLPATSYHCTSIPNTPSNSLNRDDSLGPNSNWYINTVANTAKGIQTLCLMRHHNENPCATLDQARNSAISSYRIMSWSADVYSGGWTDSSVGLPTVSTITGDWNQPVDNDTNNGSECSVRCENNNTNIIGATNHNNIVSRDGQQAPRHTSIISPNGGVGNILSSRTELRQLYELADKSLAESVNGECSYCWWCTLEDVITSPVPVPTHVRFLATCMFVRCSTLHCYNSPSSLELFLATECLCRAYHESDESSHHSQQTVATLTQYSDGTSLVLIFTTTTTTTILPDLLLAHTVPYTSSSILLKTLSIPLPIVANRIHVKVLLTSSQPIIYPIEQYLKPRTVRVEFIRRVCSDGLFKFLQSFLEVPNVFNNFTSSSFVCPRCNSLLNYERSNILLRTQRERMFKPMPQVHRSLAYFGNQHELQRLDRYCRFQRLKENHQSSCTKLNIVPVCEFTYENKGCANSMNYECHVNQCCGIVQHHRCEVCYKWCRYQYYHYPGLLHLNITRFKQIHLRVYNSNTNILSTTQSKTKQSPSREVRNLFDPFNSDSTWSSSIVRCDTLSPFTQTDLNPHHSGHSTISSSSVNIFVRLRALTQLLLMSQNLKQIIALEEAPCPSTKRLSSRTNKIVASTSTLSLDPKKQTTGNCSENLLTGHSTDWRETSHLCNDFCFKMKMSSTSLNAPKNINCPVVTRSSSSAADVLPSSEYLQYHRPSVPITTAPKMSFFSISPAKSSTPSKSTIIPSTSSSSTVSTALPLKVDTQSAPSQNIQRPSSIGKVSSFNYSNSPKRHNFLQYSKPKLRGPYAKMIESKMQSSDLYGECDLVDKSPGHGIDAPPQPLSFTEELLKKTKEQRCQLDQDSKETVGTNELEANNQVQSGLGSSDKPTESGKGDEKAHIGGYDKQPTPKQLATEKKNLIATKEVDSKKIEMNMTQPEITVTVIDTSDSSITAAIGRHLDTRAHIVGEMYDTEKTYCEALKTLHEQFFSRYSNVDIENSTSVGVLKKIELAAHLMPTIMEVHGKLLEQLRRRIANWSTEQTPIGDLFDSFDNSNFINYYLIMVEHLNDFHSFHQQNNKDATNKNSSQMKTNENSKRRYTFKELLIVIIQRIPRYELLLKRLMKHTDNDHSDYDSLNQALNLIHDILVMIGTNQNNKEPQGVDQTSNKDNESNILINIGDLNSSTQTDSNQKHLMVRDLESVIEGAQSLLDQYRPNANVHIFDYVTIKKRERAIFVLDNHIVLCQMKNRKKSDKFDYNKFKVQQVFSLENVELKCQCWPHRATSNASTSSAQTFDSVSTTSSACGSCIETLDGDIKCILMMQNQAKKFNISSVRSVIEATLKDQLQLVVNQVVEMNETISRCAIDCNVDLHIHNSCHEPSATITNCAQSTSANIPQSDKVRLVHYKCPNHQANLTQSEFEFSIAFSNFKKRADFESTVTSLRSQIFKSRFKLEIVCQIPYQKARAGLKFTCAMAAIDTNDVWICESDGFVGQISVLSNKNIDEPTVVSCNGVCTAQIVCLKAVPSFTSANCDRSSVNTQRGDSVEEVDGSEIVEIDLHRAHHQTKASPFKAFKSKSFKSNKTAIPLHSSTPLHSKVFLHSPTPSLFPLAEKATRRNSQCPGQQMVNQCIIELVPPSTSNATISPDCPTMWFGTDDSTVYIYSCYDAIRIGKNKAKVTLSAKVDSIEYFKGRVFVGLANHTVAVFTRDMYGYWKTIPSIIEGIHCYRFCVVNQDFLWTTSLNIIQIYNEEFMPIDEPIHVKDIDEISFIVENKNVFVASHNSSYIYCYSSTAPYSMMASISIGPSVNKALAMFEDIIRHHKNACLKICTMHVLHERILIGTSAGVILILDNKNTLEIVPNGHTGHVRFITSIKLKDGKVMVVSGGDGCEQFSPGTSGNMSGPTDLFHFMSYCSNLALNLLGRSSSNSNMTTVNNSAAAAAVSAAATASAVPSSKFGSSQISSSITNINSIAENDCDSVDTGNSKTVSKSNTGSEDSKSHFLIWKLI